MRDTQPPITNQEEYEGYQAGLARLNEVCADRERQLFAASGDPERLENARDALNHIYNRRQGIIDAIADYERRQGMRGA